MDNVHPIGAVARRVSEHVVDAMLNGDVPCEGPRFWGALSSAAREGKQRGVQISLIRQGFVCTAGSKAEIVTFEQADVGVLHRAIDRLAPLPELEF